MVYPTVADLNFRNDLSNASLAKYYNIPKSKAGSELYINITTTIQNCLLEYCNTTLGGSGCIEGLQAFDTDGLSYSPSNLSSTFYIYNNDESFNSFDFCEYVPKSFNPDIGGIGV